MKDTERQREVLTLWLRRAAGKRTETDLLIFYGELENSRPETLNRRSGDPYQALKVDLRAYIEQQRPIKTVPLRK